MGVVGDHKFVPVEPVLVVRHALLFHRMADKLPVDLLVLDDEVLGVIGVARETVQRGLPSRTHRTPLRAPVVLSWKMLHSWSRSGTMFGGHISHATI